MSNPHKRKKLARLKALMESKVVKEDVVSVEQVPVVVDLVVEELEATKEEILTVLEEEVKVVEEVQDIPSEVEVKKSKKKKE
jgi:predicted glycosyltransferase